MSEQAPNKAGNEVRSITEGLPKWHPIETAPNGQEVWTKIDDERGERNLQRLTRKGRLWFTHPTDGMYVYYTPTHWRP